jgi:hypothetical protein
VKHHIVLSDPETGRLSFRKEKDILHAKELMIACRIQGAAIYLDGGIYRLEYIAGWRCTVIDRVRAKTIPVSTGLAWTMIVTAQAVSFMRPKYPARIWGNVRPDKALYLLRSFRRVGYYQQTGQLDKVQILVQKAFGMGFDSIDHAIKELEYTVLGGYMDASPMRR